jgi:hypothetical protein
MFRIKYLSLIFSKWPILHLIYSFFSGRSWTIDPFKDYLMQQLLELGIPTFLAVPWIANPFDYLVIV